jgi:hypothetical protein
LDRRLGGPQHWYGHSDEEKKSQPLLGIEPYNPDHLAHSLVAILTELLTAHTFPKEMCKKVNICKM